LHVGAGIVLIGLVVMLVAARRSGWSESDTMDHHPMA
jgi:hypothetical protein